MNKTINSIALIGILTAVISINAAQAAEANTAANPMAAKPGYEACYGIAKKEKNDCMTSQHSCAGYAAKNADPSEWLFVPTGYCNKIVGGRLTAPPPNAAVHDSK
jgi:uncharacterized membrane protein